MNGTDTENHLADYNNQDTHGVWMDRQWWTLNQCQSIHASICILIVVQGDDDIVDTKPMSTMSSSPWTESLERCNRLAEL